MRRAFAAELRKLSTTRGLYFLLAAAVVVATVSTLDPSHDAATFDRRFHEMNFVFFTSLLSRVLIVVLGIRIVTDEFRYGTIVPSLLTTPRRRELLVAKGMVAAGVGALIAAVAWSAMVVVASVIARADGATLILDLDAWRSLGGTLLAGALWGAIGVGVGALIRNQVVAIVGAVVWLMGAEGVVGALIGEAESHLPGEVAMGLALSPTPRVFAVSAAAMVAYALVALLSGARAMEGDIL